MLNVTQVFKDHTSGVGCSDKEKIVEKVMKDERFVGETDVGNSVPKEP